MAPGGPEFDCGQPCRHPYIREGGYGQLQEMPEVVALDVPADQDLPLPVQNARMHPFRMQIDSAVEFRRRRAILQHASGHAHMKLFLIASTVIYGILAVLAHIMHKRMFDILRVNNPAMGAFDASLRNCSLLGLFRKKCGDQKGMMRLWWVAGILAWLASLFSLLAWIALKSYSLRTAG